MRDSTIIRYDRVKNLYKIIIGNLGEMATVVSKSYIYDKIKEKTGLCTRTIQHILST